MQFYLKWFKDKYISTKRDDTHLNLKLQGTTLDVCVFYLTNVRKQFESFSFDLH